MRYSKEDASSGRSAETYRRCLGSTIRISRRNTRRLVSNERYRRCAVFRKKQTALSYDRENQKPVIKCSICNGEQVAGFKDIRTGKFEEIMFIRDNADLREFMERYALDKVEKEY